MNLSVTDAAKIQGCTRQAIVCAIKANKLKACKVNKKWVIDFTDLQQYDFDRWSRKHSKYRGRPLFEENEYSVTNAAKQIGFKAQHLYYALREGRIEAKRKNHTWVITLDALKAYKKTVRVNRKKFVIRRVV